MKREIILSRPNFGDVIQIPCGLALTRKLRLSLGTIYLSLEISFQTLWQVWELLFNRIIIHIESILTYLQSCPIKCSNSKEWLLSSSIGFHNRRKNASNSCIENEGLQKYIISIFITFYVMERVHLWQSWQFGKVCHSGHKIPDTFSFFFLLAF